jgi:hypothetical protein
LDEEVEDPELAIRSLRINSARQLTSLRSVSCGLIYALDEEVEDPELIYEKDNYF